LVLVFSICFSQFSFLIFFFQFFCSSLHLRLCIFFLSALQLFCEIDFFFFLNLCASHHHLL
jgi:hypothetical protein